MSANPVAVDLRQPDGKKIRIHVRGDERFHWFEDVDGYTVVRDKGRYAYGRLGKNGLLEATGLTVGIDNPKARGLKKKILPPVGLRRSIRPSLMSGEDSVAPSAKILSAAKVSPAGTVKNLVVLCLFSDHTVLTHGRDFNDYDILFNKIGGDSLLAPTGSVKDIYLENSYGSMTLESTVVAWVTLPNVEEYYAGTDDGLGAYPENSQGMVEDALNLVDPLVDFSQFDDDGDGYIDAIDFIHSGYGAETGGGGGKWIWSHRWALNANIWTSGEGVRVNSYHTEPALWGTSGTNIVRFGVIAHETGHFFGLPDLYDTDDVGNGIGNWGMMANSWGFDNSQHYPPHFSAWSKIELGWITPTVISVPGEYTIGQVETNPQVYRIDHNYPAGEYLLIENRQPVGIEKKIPHGGLCIYHIDEQADDVTEGYPGQSGWPQNGSHYRVALLQADGDYDLERGNNRGDAGDVYHGGGISAISPTTTPNTHTYQGGNVSITDNSIVNVSASGTSMTFSYDDGVTVLSPQAYDVDVDGAVTIELQAVDDGMPNPPAMLDYVITSLPGHGILTDIHGVAISSVPHVLDNNENEVVYTPRLNCRHGVSFEFVAPDGGAAPDGGESNTAVVTVSIVDMVYSVDMESDPGWTFEGAQWAWGVPEGLGGWYGNSDPKAGRRGSKVVGYNLAGNYKRMSLTEWAMTGAIDCSDVSNVVISFYRWLNVDGPGYDHAYVEISNDGIVWNAVWENSAVVTDSEWTLQSYDVSAFADGQARVYVRWGMGNTNSKSHYSGWNVDDVKLVAGNPVQIDGDLDFDCEVGPDDLRIMVGNWLAACGQCNGADMSADGIVDIRDLSMLAENWLREN